MSSDQVRPRRSPGQGRSRAGVDAIVTALADLLATRRIGEITMTEIARRAGVSKAAIYRYFPTRSAVVHALAERVFGQIRDVVDETATADDVVEQFEAGLRWYFAWHRSEPFLTRLRDAIRSDPELARFDLEDTRSNAASLAAALGERSGADVNVLTDRLMLLIDLTDGMVRLLDLVDDDEADRLVEEFCTMAGAHLRHGTVTP